MVRPYQSMKDELMANTAAIEVHNLTKTYPSAGKGKERKLVLDGISFTVPENTVVSFLGHNGAGKSTLVKILSTLLDLDAGEVSIFSHDLVKDAAQVRDLISTTGQFAAVDENLTGRENLEFFGRLRGLSRQAAASRAKELLEQFELSNAADSTAASYSGGMRRRLDIAISLCVVPRLLFLDEPTTGLDPVSREQLWEYIRSLRDNGMTLVLTTQYLDEAEALADLVYLLKDHKIVDSGTPDELRARLGVHTLNVTFDSEQHAEDFIQATPLSLRRAGKNVVGDAEPNPETLRHVAEAIDKIKHVPVSLELAPPTLTEVFIRLNTSEK